MLYVTGLTGHSGKWFLKKLEEENYKDQIRVVMRKSIENAPEKYILFENTNLNLEFSIGELDDSEFLKQSLVGVDTIVHIAGITLSPKIIETAIECGVHWAILVHTTGRFSKYKSASEEYIQIEDEILAKRDLINITVLRPTMIYGSSGDRNMYRLIGYLSKHKIFPLFGDGNNLMQPVHARDLGNAYYDVLVNKEKTLNKEYDLSGKEPVKYIDIIKCVKSNLNSNIKIISIPFDLSVFAAKIYNLIFGKRAIISVEQVLRMQEDKIFSHEIATEDFGYEPLAFEEGIKKEVDEYLHGVRVDFSTTVYK